MADDPVQPLFPHDRKRRVRAPKDPELGKQLQRLMFHVYGAGYRERFHETPNVGGREWGILKTLATKYGVETLERRLRIYLNWTDPWVTSKGHTLPIFQAKWDEVRALDASSNSTDYNSNRAAAETQRRLNEWRGQSASSPTISLRSRRSLDPF